MISQKAEHDVGCVDRQLRGWDDVLGMILYCQAVLENMDILMLTMLCDLVKNSEGASAVLHKWCEKNLFGFVSL